MLGLFSVVDIGFPLVHRGGLYVYSFRWVRFRVLMITFIPSKFVMSILSSLQVCIKSCEIVTQRYNTRLKKAVLLAHSFLHTR